MGERKIIEELDDGSKMMAWTTVACQDENGEFISTEEFIKKRDGIGYGNGDYGGSSEGTYGE
jgi:hypothetical protein